MQRIDLEQWRAREVARLLSLVEAERRYYQEIVANVPVGLAVLDSDLSFLSANRTFRKIFNLEAHKMGKLRLSDLFPAEKKIKQRITDVLTTSAAVRDLSVNYEGPEGTRPLRLAIEPFRSWNDEAGTEALLLVEDVSPTAAETTVEQAEPEQRIAGDLLDNLDAIIWERDARTLQFTYVGGRVMEILGFPAQQWLHTPDFYLGRVHPEDREWVEAFYRSAVSAADSRSCEYRAITADGRTVWLRDVIRVVRDESGRPVKLSGVTVDVNAAKQRDEQLVQAEKMAALGRLAGKVTHDCNNLLMILSGYSEELLEKLPPEHPARGDVEEILAATERLSKVTGELLAFTRRPQLLPKVFRVDSLIKTLEKTLREELGERIELVLRLDPDAGNVNADWDQLGESVLTLARHARDAMPNGGRLMVETANVELSDAMVGHGKGLPAGPYVCLTVTDTGPKLDEETRLRLFEPFYTNGRAGQGFPTLYSVIRNSGGDIVVSSGRDAGATFTIYLPRVAQPAPKPEKGIPSSLEATAPKPAAKPRETVLVVEDESGIRALIRKILQKQGYTVLEASRGDEALKIAEERPEPIHLLLTDMVMPQMSGRELATRLMTARPGLKVLFVSGYSDEDLAQYGPLPDGAMFLQKPFSLATLLSKTRAVLNGTSV